MFCLPFITDKGNFYKLTHLMTGYWVNFVHREGEVVVWGGGTAEKSLPDLRSPEFCIPERGSANLFVLLFATLW